MDKLEKLKRPHKLAKPNNVKIDTSNGLTLVRRWQRTNGAWGIFGVAFLPLGWMLFQRNLPNPDALDFLVLVSIVIVGILMTYAGLAQLINSTTVSLDAEKLSIKHGPLPVKANVTVPRDKLKQIYTQKRVRQLGRRKQVSFELLLQEHNAEPQTLMADETSRDDLQFIVQEVHKALIKTRM